MWQDFMAADTCITLGTDASTPAPTQSPGPYLEAWSAQSARPSLVEGNPRKTVFFLLLPGRHRLQAL